MKPRDNPWFLLISIWAVTSTVWGLGGQVDQVQHVRHVEGEVGDMEDLRRVKREDSVSDNNSTVIDDKISSVFHLNNGHLHLMVHWAGKGSSIVFCLARDQVFSYFFPVIISICSISGNKREFNLQCVHIKRLWNYFSGCQFQIQAGK